MIGDDLTITDSDRTAYCTVRVLVQYQYGGTWVPDTRFRFKGFGRGIESNSYSHFNIKRLRKQMIRRRDYGTHAVMCAVIIVQFVIIVVLLVLNRKTYSLEGQEVCGGTIGGSLVRSVPIPRWKTDLTLSRKPVFQSSRARIECHSVMINGKQIDNWLFVEYPVRFGTLFVPARDSNLEHQSTVQLLVREKESGKFVLMLESDDSRYGLTKGSLSSASGQIEPRETPMAAARRELEEELGMR